MADAAPTTVVISYARKDGSALANRFHRDRSEHDFASWLDTREIHGGATWSKEIEVALDGSEIALTLLSEGSCVSEICRAEQLRALRHGKCVIPLGVQSAAEIPLHLEAAHYRDFSQSSGYETRLLELLNDIGNRNGAPLQPEFRDTYVTAPPPPANYVERPEALESLRNAIITEGTGRSIALTALEGMGGIGKSVFSPSALPRSRSPASLPGRSHLDHRWQRVRVRPGDANARSRKGAERRPVSL